MLVLITEFLAGSHLEMWRSCAAVLDPHSLIAIVFLSRVETGTTTYTHHISRWRPAGNSVIKTNRLAWTAYRELSNLSCWCKHKLKKTLIWNWYCWTAEVPFKKTSSSYNFGINKLLGKSDDSILLELKTFLKKKLLLHPLLFSTPRPLILPIFFISL